jgi:uncharacterized protein (DUF488 family)
MVKTQGAGNDPGETIGEPSKIPARGSSTGGTARTARGTPRLATIGYELATVESFLTTLREAGVQLVVDVRAVAGSRRPGFAKTRLAANLEEAGIGYVHLRGLGTPSEGRAAARAGRHDEMRAIFREHLGGSVAQDDLATLLELVRSSRVCVLCLEADPTHCHRSLVADAVAEHLPVRIEHLDPTDPSRVD